MVHEMRQKAAGGKTTKVKMGSASLELLRNPPLEVVQVCLCSSVAAWSRCYGVLAGIWRFFPAFMPKTGATLMLHM